MWECGGDDGHDDDNEEAENIATEEMAPAYGR